MPSDSSSAKKPFKTKVVSASRAIDWNSLTPPSSAANLPTSAPGPGLFPNGSLRPPSSNVAPIFTAAAAVEPPQIGESVSGTNDISGPTAETTPAATGAVSKTPPVPEDIRPHLGPGFFLEGEDSDAFERLLALLGAELGAAGLIEWLLVKDVADRIWATKRCQRQSDSVVRRGRRKAMEDVLALELHKGPESASNPWAVEVIKDWFAGKKPSIEWVNDFLERHALSMADITAQSVSNNAVELDHIDQQILRHQDRRDRSLREIDRRRMVAAKHSGRLSDDVVDADYHDTTPEEVGRSKIHRISGGSR